MCDLDMIISFQTSFKITLNLFIASVKEAAEKDPSLSNLIEAIEKNQRQHDE